MRILMIDGDRDAAAILARAGHEVSHAGNHEPGLARARTEGFDVLLIDGDAGRDVLMALREAGDETPALILDKPGPSTERVDYLRKPFAFTELLARLEALADGAGAASELTIGDLEMNLCSHQVRRAGRPIALSASEFRLLEMLMRHAGHVLTRTMLLEKVWDQNFDPQTDVIDRHVSRLRMKIDQGFEPPLIHQVRGGGFILRPPDHTSDPSSVVKSRSEVRS
ncbi:MAG TPA: response regulator transcription factor [Stellaceae bacterium]|nr:response regulator transcription factor [Stellaceae bacterium]